MDATTATALAAAPQDAPAFTEADGEAVRGALPALLPLLGTYDNTRASQWGSVQ